MNDLREGILKRIHVNQHVIRENQKAWGSYAPQPPLTVKTSSANHKAFAVSIEGPSMLLYRPDKPLDCGARVWIETRARVLLATQPLDETSVLPSDHIFDIEETSADIDIMLDRIDKSPEYGL